MSSELFRKYIDMINEAEEGGPADIQQVATQLKFLPTHKKDLTYTQLTVNVTPENINQMPALSFGIAEQDFILETVTEDGHETTKPVKAGDYVVSGPSKEKYSPGNEQKFIKNYPIEAGPGKRKPDIRSFRMVAVYTGNQPVSFTAPWGTPMTLKPNDYLVQETDAEGKYYRIAKFEYEQTYNPPGK